MRLKVNDQVMVTSGNHKGEKGRIKKILRDSDRVIISGVNLSKKHVRPSKDHPQGGRIDIEGTIAMSAVMPYDAQADKATRVRIAKVDGKKVRVSVVNGGEYGERY